MNRHRQTFVRLATVALIAQGALSRGWAQSQAAHSEQVRAEEAEPSVKPTPPARHSDGFWPTPKLLDSLLRRSADGFGSNLDLDDEQRPRFRDMAAKRWGAFLSENRDSIQPVFTEFLEMRLGYEPPTKEQIEDWAGRALPVFRSVREQIEGGTDDLRNILKPAQRIKFEMRRLKFEAGLAFAEAKLTLAESGQITEDDLEDFWQPTRDERKRRRDRAQKRKREEAAVAEASANATTTPGEAKDQPDVIAEELAAWTKYVSEFMQTYDFNDGQRDAALSFLSELRGRAITHRDMRREEIVRLEERITRFDGAEKELADLKKQLDELYGPIDKMFAELKRRVEAIPTARQRAAVTSHLEQPAAGEPPTPPEPKP